MAWNMRKLSNEVLVSNSMCLKWAQDNSLIPINPHCNICGIEMMIKIKGATCFQFQCREKGENQHSVINNALLNTFFEYSKFGIRNIITIMYYFSVNQTHYDFLIRECSLDNIATSTKNISAWLSYCREVCFVWIYDLFNRRELLGGQDFIVEIEEFQIGKQKYKRGRVVEGTWVLFIFEINIGKVGRKCRNEGKYKIELCPGNKRDANTLIPIILKHLKPGTTIVTELWKSFFQLTDGGYTCFSVNHDHNLMQPIGSTNKINSCLGTVKKSLKSGLYNDFSEFIYRREVLMSGEDPFDYFIRAVKHCFPVPVHEKE